MFASSTLRYCHARMIFLFLWLGLVFGKPADLLPPGHRPPSPGTHALVGGTVVTRPGHSLNNATIIIRDGVIEAVGSDLPLPPAARPWDMTGRTIYAGFIDPYVPLGPDTRPVSTADSEPIVETRESLRAGGGLRFYGVPGEERDPGNSGPGSSLGGITPEKRVAERYAPKSEWLDKLRQTGFTSANVVSDKGILRGTTAFVALSDDNPNQAVIKSDVFQQMVFDTDRAKDNAYPGSLMGVIAAIRQAFFNADFYARDHAHFQTHPRSRPRPEFNPALEALLPAARRMMPVVIEPGSALMVHRAARLAEELHLDYVLVSSGQEWRRPDLARATEARFIVPVDFPEMPKLPSDDDWRQVSLDQLRMWDWAPENPLLLRQQNLQIALTTFGLSDVKQFRKKLLFALDRGLTEDDALAALTINPARWCGLDDQLGTIEAGKTANLTVVAGDSYFDPDNPVESVWIDGRPYLFPREPKKPDDDKKAPGEVAEEKGAAGSATSTNGVAKIKTDLQSRNLRKKRLALSPLEGRGPITNPPAILIEHAAIWTCGSLGLVQNASLLAVEGRIRAVGTNVTLPADLSENALIVDAQGEHLTPGLIDCHSHSMILGRVNEGTLPSTAMVRVEDVVNSESANLYRELAGGLTTCNLLHGSANPIGGQNCIIKLRDGASPEDLKLAGAPPGIKFALGENVKQSNWGDRNVTRFPQTRMGVRTFIANRFTAAQRYLADLERAPQGGPPVRRDLELEAIGEILQGKRWIHCHCYRQDEILAFLRLMEQFHVQVGTLQHVLEGYKIADEIAEHGAGASCFSDWWAYKFEVYDAIPYAGSLMHARGVLVSFNSDSSDLARRLNLEAAKAVKYGGTPELEALDFVTINPAKQLRIDRQVGSLEPGKDADFVLWSKSPLDSGTVCLQTWIDGKKYFDRSLDAARAEALEAERTSLVEKAKKLSRSPSGKSPRPEIQKVAFFRTALEHQHENENRHCLDDE